MPGDRTLNRTLVRGTSAERAAYTPYPPPAVTEHDATYLFFDTDLAVLFAWDGSTWRPASINAPTSATSGDLAQFADATGKVLSDSGVPAAQVARKDQTNVFTSGDQQLTVAGASRLTLTDTTQATDQKTWRIVNSATVLYLRTINDALTAALVDALVLNRSGDATVGRNLSVTGSSVLGGPLTFSPDTTNDIGALSSGRPRDLLIGRDANVVRNLGVGGGLVLNGGQIQFPTPAIPSAVATVMDDYREGTWTPSLVQQSNNLAPGLSYNQASGAYTKIGNVVVWQFIIYLSNKGTCAGMMRIAGWPFSANASFNTYMPILFLNWATNWINIVVLIGAGGTSADLYGMQSASTSSFPVSPQFSDLTNTSFMMGTGMYLAS